MEDVAAIVTIAEKVLSFTFLRPNQEIRLYNICCYIYLSVACTSASMLIYCSFFNPEFEVDLGSLVEASVTVFQISSRVIVLNIYKQNINDLITFVKSFSHSKICASIVAIRSKCWKFSSVVKAYATFIIFTEVTAVVGFIFEEEKLLILGGGMTSFHPIIYYFFVAIQIFALCLECSLCAGFDCCFASLCFSFALYSDIITYKFENLDKSNETDEIQTCVNSYADLRRNISVLIGTYSVFLFVQFCISVGANFVEMFLVLDSYRPKEIIARFVFVFVSFMQWCLYCMAAQEVSEGNIEVGRASYFCRWETSDDKNTKLSSYLTVMLSQKMLYITAGKMISVDRAAMALVFKTALSLLSVMRSLK